MDRSSPAAAPPSSPHTANGSAAGSNGTPRARAPTRDALDLNSGDGGPEEAEEEGAPGHVRRSRRPRNTVDRNVPVVRDVTGEKAQETFEAFLKAYMPPPEETQGARDEEEEEALPLYVRQIRVMRDHDISTLYVDYTHVLLTDPTLANAITQAYYRFLPYLRRAVQALVREFAPTYLYFNPSSSASAAAGLQMRDFSIAFYNLPLVAEIRQLRTEKIGKLASISGTVTRTSEVRPELTFGTFKCQVCQGVVSDIEQQFKYTEPNSCPNPLCNNRSAWEFVRDSSKFTDWQRVRIQENANEIPTGSMPRSLDVILRGELVERAKAGDKCVFTGTLIVVPDVSQLGVPGVNAEMMREAKSAAGAAGAAAGVTGLKSLGVRDLQYKLAFLACMVTEANTVTKTTNVREDVDDDDEARARNEVIRSMTVEELKELMAMRDNEYIYSDLVQSIAPTVYGHELVKKGLLLQLMGGVHKTTQEGMNLRGDINICIVGDPSTSKSQFLKYICSFLPRSVYTSGKASSAAGLTAAVVKDEETGEFTIEAGALMLADNGICAIDEFDKMDISDQVAIHEAMEQQTISIAKAGIHATLNARTSILAAANPIGGRYNRKQTLRQNIAMSPPIMSRFDLFFVVLDECNEQTDLNIANHIVNVHRFQDEAVAPIYSTETIQRYIRYARTFNPMLSREAYDMLIEKYRILRQDDAQGAGRNSYRITVRQLESMIRLSEAIARVNCSEKITPNFVREAYSLLRQSIIHVEQDDIDFDNDDEDEQRPPPPPGGGPGSDGGDDDGLDGDGDVPMDGTDYEMADDSVPQQSAPGDASSSTHGAVGPSASTPAPPAAPPRKFKITHDQYMSMQSLIVMHLAEVDRQTGGGVDRDDLIDWWLESKEAELHNIEDLEYEKELLIKVLRRLTRDHYLIEHKGEVQESLPSVADESQESQGATGDNVKIIYVLHPAVDPDNALSNA